MFIYVVSEHAVDVLWKIEFNVFTLTLALLFNSIVSSKATLSTIEKELDLIDYFICFLAIRKYTHTQNKLQ